MVKRSQIRKLSRRIADEFQPEQIILFGSYAYGEPTEDSDVDLLIIMPFKGKGYRKAAEIRDRVRPGFALDLIVRTPAVLRQRLAWNDFFLQEVVEKGEILYAASHE